MSRITAKSINIIIDQLNLKKQNGLQRRIADVRRFYAKHSSERKRILGLMSESIPEVQSAPSVPKLDSQLSNASMDTDLPTPT